jgi:hypothetical protein
MQPPPPDSRAIFEHAFGGEVATITGVGAGALDQPGLGDAVAGRVRELRALLEIDHEIDRDPGFAGPMRIGWRGTIADKIAGHLGSPGPSILISVL